MRGWKFWLGVVVGVSSLVYFSSDLDPKDFADSWKQIHVVRYLEGVFWFCLSFWFRCPRWQILVSEVKSVSLKLVTQTFFVGMLINRVLIARLGEIARCVLLKRHTGASLVGLLVTLVTEKAFDSLALLTVTLVGISLFPTEELPAALGELLDTHRTKFVVTAIGVPFVLWIGAWFLPWIIIRSARFAERQWHAHFHKFFSSIQSGLWPLRSSSRILGVTFWTALAWLTLIRSEYCAIQSFGWDLPASSAVVLCATISLAVMLPQAPSFIGVYQIAVQWAMVELYGVPLQEGKAFAVAIWFMQIVPVGVIGFVCLRMLGDTISEATETEEIKRIEEIILEKEEEPKG